jgi:hypothetical protein
MHDCNSKLNAENGNLTRDNEHCAAENYDMRKGVDHHNAKNADMAANIRDTEALLKEKESALFVTRRDLDGQRAIAQTSTLANEDHLAELH